MALAGEVKIFVATMGFDGGGGGGEAARQRCEQQHILTLTEGDQLLVHDDGATLSAEWVYGAHQDGRCGWVPRYAGQLFKCVAPSDGSGAGRGTWNGPVEAVDPIAVPIS